MFQVKKRFRQSGDKSHRSSQSILKGDSLSMPSTNGWHLVNVFTKRNWRFFRERHISFRYSHKSKILLLFLHGFGDRDLHITITRPLGIWLWVLGLHIPRLALIWELKDIDEKMHIKQARSFTKEMIIWGSAQVSLNC